MPLKYWLMKSEPDAFSFDDLGRSREQSCCWDGVRNYQARNLLRDEVARGDRLFYYHSRGVLPAIVGLARVVRAGYPDPTQFDRRSPHYDPKSTSEAPRWFAVEIQYDRALARPVTLSELRDEARLASMVLVNNSRLSVQPVQPDEWKTVLELARRPANGS